MRNAAGFKLRRLRILVPVDQVFVQALIHEPTNLGLYPCLAEGSQVLARVPIKQQFIVHQLVVAAGVVSPFRKLMGAGSEGNRDADTLSPSLG